MEVTENKQINKPVISYFLSAIVFVILCSWKGDFIKDTFSYIIQSKYLTLIIVVVPIIILLFDFIQTGFSKSNTEISLLLEIVKYSTIGFTVVTLTRELFLNKYFPDSSLCKQFDWYTNFGIMVSIVVLLTYWLKNLVPLGFKIFYKKIEPDKINS